MRWRQWAQEPTRLRLACCRILPAAGNLWVTVAEQGTNQVEIYTDSATGTLTLDTTYGTGATPTAIAVGSFNNDGIPDMAVAYSTGVTVLLGSANGTIISSGGVAVGTQLSAIAVGHFNGGKNVDLAVTDQAANMVYILPGSGNGTFTEGGSYATGTTPESISVGDFNKDGKLDIAVGNYGGLSVSVYLGKATAHSTHSPSMRWQAPVFHCSRGPEP